MPIDAKTAQWADSELKNRNYAGAAEKLQYGLLTCPDDVEARNKLRLIGRKNKIENPPSGLAKVKFAGKLAKMRAVLMTKKDPKEFVEEAERYLFEDPNNVEVLLETASYLIRLEMLDVAEWMLEDVTKLETDNALGWKALGNFKLKKREDPEAAKQCYLKVKLHDPKDKEVDKILRQIEAEAITSTGSTHARDALKDTDETLRREVESRVIRNAEDAKAQVKFLLDDLKEDPKNIKIMEKISDRYRQGELFKESIEYLQKAFELEPSNQSLQMRIGDIRLQRVNVQIEKLELRVKKDPSNDEFKAKLKKARLVELKTGLETYKERVESFPNDQGLKFKFGEYLYNAKKFKEGLAQFQKAITDPKVSDQANEYLARCFMQLDKAKMALKPIDNCVEKAIAKSGRWKDMLYLKGQCLVQMEQKDEAVALFEQIYEIDIDYRDVADLI